MKWFKHDSTANRDAKLEKVLLKYGADGYALYWLCIELIADRIDATHADFELEHDAELLGARLKIDTLRVEEIMRYFVSLELFENDGNRITCMKLAARLENAIVKNPALKKIQAKLTRKSVETPEESENFRELPGTSGIIPDNLGQIRLDRDRDRDIENTNTQECAREEIPKPKESESPRPDFNPALHPEIKAPVINWPDLYTAWMKTPGTADPGVFRFCQITARKLIPLFSGLTSEQVFKAVENFQDMLSRPTWWTTTPSIVTWAEKHIDRFLPGNYNPEEYRKEETAQEANARYVKEAMEKLNANNS